MIRQEGRDGPLEWGADRTTTGRSFLRDTEGLWADMLRFAAIVEETLAQAIQAMRDGRVELAREVKQRRKLIDRREVEIERECVRVLALHQPVASDLRRVAAVLKINGDLHRLGDLARHVAKRVKKLAAAPQGLPVPQPLEDLSLDALERVHESLDALTRADVALARRVIDADQRIDRAYRALQKQLKEEIQRGPERLDTLLRWVNTARNLERVADHAVKIAEAVIYLEEGDVLRHQPRLHEPQGDAPVGIARAD